MLKVSEVKELDELTPFINSLKSCPKTGLHNPLKNLKRYLDYGNVCSHTSAKMREPAIQEFFVSLIQRVAPKSHAQALGEFIVTKRFLENFSGDQVRFLARSFSIPGDHDGQSSHGYRWPYGPVVIIAPFNFPLEIPMLQLMGKP
jgi:1-pyrroline-5-carboxylate dehydrogenase